MNSKQVFQMKGRNTCDFTRLEDFLSKLNHPNATESRQLREIRALDYVTNKFVPANSSQKNERIQHDVEDLKRTWGSLERVINFKMILVRKRFQMLRDFSVDS